MININWGWKIAIFYSSFVLGMLFLVYKTSTVKTELVTKDYYAQELVYQDELDAKNRAQALHNKLSLSKTAEQIVLSFPQEFNSNSAFEGKVKFYCAADSKRDKEFKIDNLDNGIFSVPITEVKEGRYTMKVSWSKDGVLYLQDFKINI
jgi:hypothetical protein